MRSVNLILTNSLNALAPKPTIGIRQIFLETFPKEDDNYQNTSLETMTRVLIKSLLEKELEQYCPYPIPEHLEEEFKLFTVCDAEIAAYYEEEKTSLTASTR